MPNIMLTYRCNLSCSYCFANEFVNSKATDISFTAFQKAIDFLTTSDNHHIGLIGGEPTIHPQFSEMLKYIEGCEKIEGATIYTNGIIMGDFADLFKNSKFSLLVNCNSPKDIGKAQFDRLCKSLDRLFECPNAKQRINFGVNLYSNDFVYSYIISLLERYDLHKVRISVTVPNTDNLKSNDALDYLKSRKQYVYDFLQECDRHLIVPYYDCNVLPSCVWNDDEANWMKEYIKKYRVRKTNLVGQHSFCQPVIDILPTLQAVRCFGFSDYLKVDISEFRSLDDLRKYYINKIDVFAFHVCAKSNQCKKCYYRDVQQCAVGCMSFVQKEIKTVYDAVHT